MTAQIFFGFREMAFFMIFSSFFFKITDIKKLAKKHSELHFLILIVSCCQGTLRRGKSGVQE